MMIELKSLMECKNKSVLLIFDQNKKLWKIEGREFSKRLKAFDDHFFLKKVFAVRKLNLYKINDGV